MQIEFKYTHIKVDQFATFNGIVNSRQLAFQTTGGVQTGFNYDSNTIVINVSAEVKVENQIVMTVKVSSFFEISPESWKELEHDGFVVIPKDFLYHIGGLAVSTTRGILYAKTEGTDLSSYIMPIVYMNKVIHSDMRIPIRQ